MRPKEKISVSLSHELLKAIETNQGIFSRSSFIEQGMRDYLLAVKGVLVPIRKKE